jgi:uncharacterized protein Veg
MKHLTKDIIQKALNAHSGDVKITVNDFMVFPGMSFIDNKWVEQHKYIVSYNYEGIQTQTYDKIVRKCFKKVEKLLSVEILFENDSAVPLNRNIND